MLNRSFTIAALNRLSVGSSAALAAPVALAASTAKAYSGPSVAMRWGNVAVTITVSNNKVVAVRATYPTERPRSSSSTRRPFRSCARRHCERNARLSTPYPAQP